MVSLLNKRFGRLLVISIAGTKNRLIVYKCKCDCGKDKQVTSRNLKRGSTKSCGCLKIDMYKNKKNSAKFEKVMV